MADGTGARSPAHPRFEQLVAMFTPALPYDAILAAWVQHEGNVEACAECLVSVLQAGAAADASADQSTRQDLWNPLPHDVKLIILSKLTSRDIAQAAASCKSMATVARQRRTRKTELKFGGRISQFRAFLNAHVNAFKVDVSAVELHHIVHFEDLAAQLKASHRDSVRRVPIQYLVIRNSDALDQDCLQLLLEACPTIHSLDLTNCAEIGNAAVSSLAVHSVAHWNTQPDATQLEQQLQVAPVSEGITTATASPSAWAKLPQQAPEASLEHPASASGTSGMGPAPAPATDAHNTTGPTEPGSTDNLVTGLTAPSAGELAGALQSSTEGLFAQGSSADPSTALQNSPQALAATVPASAEGSTPPQNPSQESLACPMSSSNVLPAEAGLQLLVLQGCTGVTDSGLNRLVRAGISRLSLHTLNVSSCKAVNLSFLPGLPNDSPLHTLSANNCRSVVNLSVHMPSSALQTLSLRQCIQLRTLQLKLPQLQSLNVTGCKALMELKLATPRLKVLQSGQCAQLVGPLFEGRVSMLETANFANCRTMQEERLDAMLNAASSLKELTLTGCKQLSRLRVPDGCPLQELQANGCRCQIVSVRCRTLAVLEVRNVKELKRVCLAVPVQRVDVHNCEALEDVTVQDVGVCHGRLARVEVGNCCALAAGAKASIEHWAELTSESL